METMLIRDRYKVIRTLWAQPDYALVEAVDIQDREVPLLLINLYEGELARRYGLICSAIQPADCPAFRGMFLEGDTLGAVFENCWGQSIDRVFYRGDHWRWRERLEFAQLVLHQALTLANLPPEVSCAVMCSENFYVDPEERRVRLRFMLRPMEELSQRELPLLAGDQLKKILPPRRFSMEAEKAFLKRVDRGEWRSIVAMYADWKTARDAIQKEYEEFEKKNFIQRGFWYIRRAFRSVIGRERKQ